MPIATSPPSIPEPTLPIPISHLPPNYLIFSPDAQSYLRKTHRIAGVLTGTIPQTPQQNVFQGLPLLLLPEEVRLLVEKGVAYVVDDKRAHQEGLKALRKEEKSTYLRGLEREVREMRKVMDEKKMESRERGLAREAVKRERERERDMEREAEAEGEVANTESTLFSSESPSARPPSPTPSATSTSATSTLAWTSAYTLAITPHTSYPAFHPPSPIPESVDSIPVPPSYPLFSHLHAQNFFLSPGLRFGCHYLAYPGDPLRFHSHFLAVGKGWNEEWDVMEIVGGGRLGTGVKKSFMIGGKAEEVDNGSEEQGGGGDRQGDVRCFCIEWAGM
jgi:tRNA-splicing endonuclease subunit Sen34